MKLIACLIVLSSIFTFLSTGLAGPKISTEPEGHLVLDQLPRAPSPFPSWWSWDVWLERVFPPRRRWRKHKPGRLERLQRRVRRWHRQRRRQGRRLRRQWQELRAGTVQAQQATAPDQPAVCAEETCATAIASNGEQRALNAQAPTAEVVAAASPTPRRGPGRPRTTPTSHRCCPNEACPAYGRLGDDPLHDAVASPNHAQYPQRGFGVIVFWDTDSHG